MQWSTALRNARLSAIVSTVGNSPVLCLYGGTMPAACADAVGANNSNANPLLAEFSLGASWMGAPANGTMTAEDLPLTTLGTSVAGGGTVATFYRLYASDGVTCHEQGTVTEANADGDLTIDNVSIANGQTVNINSWTRTEPGP